MANPAHHHHARVPHGFALARPAAVARRLRVSALAVLVAYAISCFVLTFSRSDVPASVDDLGVLALLLAGCGVLVPRPTGLVLVLVGAVVGPATWLLARAAGNDYAASVDPRLLVFFFAPLVAAGALILLADGVDDADRPPS